MDFEELISVGIWVVNKKNDRDGIYIGRGGILGNRYVMGKDGDREEVIEKYREWLWEVVKKKEGKAWEELKRLLGIWKRDGELKLSCFCFPKRCHGEVIGSCLVWMKKEGM
jgi:hypothetical protein